MNHPDAETVLAEFKRRDSTIRGDKYALSEDVNLFFYQGRIRCALALLRSSFFFPCSAKRILEVGCGARGWLPDFESWGVPRANLAGIDLDEDRVRTIRRLLSGYSPSTEAVPSSGADIRIGDASRLPWDSGTFDLVIQSTVFTSILSDEHKRRVAAEMLRVIKRDGLILWYDFAYNNPTNPNVRGVGLSEVKKLFPDCDFRSRRVTLAPPVARVVVPSSWLVAELLQALRLLNTHRLVVIKKQAIQ